jgi:hypothetical protein
MSKSLIHRYEEVVKEICERYVFRNQKCFSNISVCGLYLENEVASGIAKYE